MVARRHRGGGRVVRIAVFAVACVLGLGEARPADAQDAWYVLYRDGVSAYKSGNDTVAEQKLLGALKHRLAPSTRGRSVLYISQTRGEFFPEYYLTLVYTRMGRHTDAMAYAKLAEDDFRSGDAEFVALTAARETAERALKAPGPEERLAEQRRQFDQLMAASATAISARQFTDARQTANRARALGIDTAAADALMRRIDIADLTSQIEAALAERSWTQATSLIDRQAGLKPGGTQIQVFRTAVSRGLAEDKGRQLERDGLIAFYRGEYAEAERNLSQVGEDIRSVRGTFYLACTRGALALLEGSRGTDRLSAAKVLYARAQPAQPLLQPDRRYVSPAILNALER